MRTFSGARTLCIGYTGWPVSAMYSLVNWLILIISLKAAKQKFYDTGHSLQSYVCFKKQPRRPNMMLYSAQVCHRGVRRLLRTASLRHEWRDECARGRWQSDVRWRPSVVPESTMWPYRGWAVAAAANDAHQRRAGMSCRRQLRRWSLVSVQHRSDTCHFFGINVLLAIMYMLRSGCMYVV